MIDRVHFRFFSSERSVTLLELIIVLLINVILAASLVPALSRYRSVANASVCKSNLKALGFAEEAFKIDRMTYLAVDAWGGSANELLNYVQGPARDRRRCPKSNLDYIISPVTDIRNSYKIICRSAGHPWQVRTGVAFFEK